MRVFTNKYFNNTVYSVIQKNLQNSNSIMKIDNKIYIPALINDINIKNNKLYINTTNSNIIPSRVDEYVAKFYYFKDQTFDLIDADDQMKLYINIDKNYNKKIIVSKNIIKGDIILIEDTDKFGVV